MNKILHSLATILLFLPILPSCRKNDGNPPETALPPVQFQLSLNEIRDRKVITWTVTGNGYGGWKTENDLGESIETPVVTAVEGNTITLQSSKEVNIASSDTKCVAIEAVNKSRREFRLLYKGDGSSTIRVWNGSGDDTIEQSFIVESRTCVDMEGLLFRYAGEELTVRHYFNSRPVNMMACEDDWKNESAAGRPDQSDFLIAPYAKPQIWRWYDDGVYGTFVTDPDQGALLEFLGLYPENCSYRRIYSFESEWDYYCKLTETLTYLGIIEEGEYSWPNIKTMDADAWDYAGTSMWIALDYRYYMACIKLMVPEPRYYYLYHAFEDFVSK